MKLKQVFFTVAISALTTIGVMWGYGKMVKSNNTYAGQDKAQLPANYQRAGFFDGEGSTPPTNDFTAPSQAAIPTVVHIKTKTAARQVSNNLPRQRQQQRTPFDDFFSDDIMQQFFGNRNMVIPEQQASGSGVIISQDGYIVTNNHVVDKADELTVTLSNRKSYKAKVIGADPAFDLAVIKIEAAGLPFLVYGNSDDVKIGQWVLALGYPLDLEATVTAGIVSAKARSIGLNKEKDGKSGVESFIQTDAAVNKGNSGGALINTDGKLIGINSAIFSPTGFYSGYSYAIPVNIVKKVVDDMIKYGNVQRGFLGVATENSEGIDNEEKKRYDLNFTGDGLVVTSVAPGSAAEQAGIKKGDILKKVNGTEVSVPSELQETVVKMKPGDKVEVLYSRGGRDYATTATLKNKAGNFDIVKQEENNNVALLGAELMTLDKKKAAEYGIAGGVVVKRISEGALNDQTRMKDGFIILKINEVDVKSMEDLKKQVGTNKEITLSGFYPGYDGLYEYPISLEK